MKQVFLLFLLGGMMLASCLQDAPSVDLSPFHLQPEFQIELVASEPLIRDPVAMEIDEHGNCYVVEMPGYPLDVSGSGRVTILKDTDGDGQMDESIIFADQLTLPTGIMRWKDGVIITDAPDVLYLEDTDGDGKADKREVLLTGFARSNPQHNMNSPTYGLDNWIYLGHEGAIRTSNYAETFGGRGEGIRFPDDPHAPSLPQNADGKSLRFQPDQKRLEMLSGKTQFKFTFDNWGHLFQNSNASHLYHEVIAARYLDGKQYLPLKSSRNYLPDYGPGAEIYPRTLDPQFQILTDRGTITSACGSTWYQGGNFPEEFDHILFTAEPVHNLVHTDLIAPNGASFVAHRQYEQEEFLASEDSWFRPVNFYIGPEGNLYVLDYHRQYVEHPEWMEEEVVEAGQLYNGTDKGRIYKISPVAKPGNTDQTYPGELPEEKLIPLLAHPNIWWRRHAQRLLLHHKQREIPAQLIAFARSTPSDLGLLHAMWTLEGMGQFEEELLEKALSHSAAGVRENAIKIAELHLDQQPELLDKLLSMKDDPDPKVRFQFLCTLSLSDQWRVKRPIFEILFSDLADEWVQYVALASAESDMREYGLLSSIIKETWTNQGKGVSQFVSKASEMVGKRGDPDKIRAIISLATQGSKPHRQTTNAAMLAGLAKGMQEHVQRDPSFLRQREQLLQQFHPDTYADMRSNSLALLAKLGLPTGNKTTALELAQTTLGDSSAESAFVVDAIQLLSLDNPSAYLEQFSKLIHPTQPVEVQKAALQALQKGEGKQQIDQYVFENWESFTPELKREGIAVMMKRESSILGMLHAVESGKLHKSHISWNHAFRLLNHRNPEIKTLARSLLSGEEKAMGERLESYQAALNGKGNVQKGQQLFRRTCSSCHQMAGQGGIDFGPDLAAIRNRSESSILQDILAPNQAIADGYGLWKIDLVNGASHAGIIIAETHESIVLKDASGRESSISRKQIKWLEEVPLSAMPEGLEAQISLTEMRDLLAYLKRPYLVSD